jgi:uncharacterized protein (DUF2236 family)
MFRTMASVAASGRGALFPSEEDAAGLLVGPESVAWSFGSDPRLYLGMLYPLLLQVADPVVGAGVRDFSDFDVRPWARLIGTLDYVTLLIYGGRDAAAMGRRLRAMHKQFRGVREDGKPYYALEPDAYAWVHATLIEAYVAGHANFGRPMTAVERDRFYHEYRGLGRFVGVREADLPEDWGGFRDYFDEFVENRLVRTASVERVLRSVTHAQPPMPMPDTVWRAIRLPARKALWLGSIGAAGPRLREKLGIPWSGREETQFRRLSAVSRGATPLMPRALRTVGPAQLRMRRQAIARGPLGPGNGPAKTPADG